MKMIKMKMHSFFLVGCLIASCIISPAQDTLPKRPLSFENAWDISRQNSHVMKQMNYLKQEKSREANAAKGYYLPKIGLTASYVVMSKDLDLDLTPVKDAITPLYSTLSNYGNFSGVVNPLTGQTLPDAYSTQSVRTGLAEGLESIESANWDQIIQKDKFGVVAATVTWPIFTGGKIYAANQAAKIESQEAEETARQKEGELACELVERYYGLCLAQQAEAVRLDVYKGMQKHLSDAEKMGKQGLIAKADVLHAKVYNAQAERELTKAHRSVEILNNALLNTLAMDTSIQITPVSELFYLDKIESSEYFKKLAEENNPQLQQVESKKKLAKQNQIAHRSEFMPDIAVEGMYNIADMDLSPYTPDWLVGVGMKWTLFDGTARYQKSKAASDKIKQANEFGEKASADIETKIEKLSNELQMYREQLTELDTALEFAKEYLRLREKAFQEDMSNSTEVTDARLALSKVSIERLQAMYGFDVTLMQLLQFAGVPEKFNEYRTHSDAKTESYKALNE
jgi:outer membrane protein TolC